MFCLASQSSHITALMVLVVVIEPQNKLYSFWVKRVGKHLFKVVITGTPIGDKITTYCSTIFLMFSCFYSSPLNLHKLNLAISSYSPAVTSCPYLTTSLVQCFHRKSPMESTQLWCQCLSPFLLPHLRTPHSTKAGSCLAPNYFTPPDRFRKLKTSSHDVPNRKRYLPFRWLSEIPPQTKPSISVPRDQIWQYNSVLWHQAKHNHSWVMH